MAIDPISVGDVQSISKINQAIAKANLVDGKAELAALASEASARTAADAAEATARTAADTAEAATRASADAAEATLRAAADTKEASLRAAADANLAASINQNREDLAREFSAGNWSRPGEAAMFWTHQVEGDPGALDPISPSLVRIDSDGNVVRITGSGKIGPIRAYRIEAGRLYRVRFVVRRRVNPADPANHTVRLALRWLSRGKGAMPTAMTVVQDLNSFVVANGRTIVTKVIATAAGTGVDIVSPPGVVYLRPYGQTYGNDGTTDFEVAELVDITDALNFSPDVSALEGRVGAIESLDVGTQLEEIQSQLGGAEIRDYLTRATVAAATISSTVDVIRVMQYNLSTPVAPANYNRAAVEPSHPAKVQSADGAWWELAEPVVDPHMVGAVGNGSVDDRVAYGIAQDAMEQVFLPSRAVFNLEDEYPAKPLYGQGRFKHEDVEYGGYFLRFRADGDTIAAVPKSMGQIVKGNIYPAISVREDTNYFNTILSVGSVLDDEGKAVGRSTAVGFGIGQAAVNWLLTDAFGAQAMAFSVLSDRNTAVGSETMVWGGTRTRSEAIANKHGFFNGVLPNDPAWNVNGLEALYPGVRTRIWDFNNYAAVRQDFAQNACLGRDALLLLTRGIDNVGGGYQSMANLFEGYRMTGLGAGSLKNGVFNNDLVGIGYQAGKDVIDSTRGVFIGSNAGVNVQAGSESTIVGGYAGFGAISAVGAVLIGHRAGQELPTNLNNKFVLANKRNGLGAPLLSGDFSSINLGMNIAPADIAALLHIRGSNSGVAPTLGATGIFLERASGDFGIQLASSNTATVGLLFADSGAPNAGGMVYEHSTDTLYLRASTASRLRITGTGMGFNGSAAIAKPAVTGSRGGNAALASLLTQLASYGLITDSTTA